MYKLFSIFLKIDEKKQLILKEVFPIISKIDEKSCNFFSDDGVYDGKSKIVVRLNNILFTYFKN